jgi:3-hydroxyisobutyrate dehydrogenase
MTEPDAEPVGFIGLGNMGGPIAANLAHADHPLVVHDAAGTQARAPARAEIAGSAAEVARRCPVVLLSLPDGAVVAAVAEAIGTTDGRACRCIADTSTIGVSWARRIHARLAELGIEYVDAPVSGGVSGARAGTISVMYSGTAETLAALRPVFESMSGAIFDIGREPGQGQAMKVLNNFLSGTAMAATAEAVAFGEAAGLDMATMLDVLNVSTGRNTATSDKFVNRVLTGTFDAGFTCTQMDKDMKLYREGVAETGVSDSVSESVARLWTQFDEAEPGADISRIYPFIRAPR